MLSKEDIQTIYSDCRAILLLQDEETGISVSALSRDYDALSDHNLEDIAIVAGFTSVARFLRASIYFHVFRKEDQVLVRLADQNSVDKGKKKVNKCIWPWNIFNWSCPNKQTQTPPQKRDESGNARKVFDPIENVAANHGPLKKKSIQTNNVEQMEVDPSPNVTF